MYKCVCVCVSYREKGRKSIHKLLRASLRGRKGLRSSKEGTYILCFKSNCC